MLKDLRGTYKKGEAKKVIAECTRLAKEKSYSHFAIETNRMCYSGPDLARDYKSGGEDDKMCTKFKLGRKGGYAVYKIL